MEGAIDGFFFEISKGAICAGNVFVGCDKGIRVLNSSNVRLYQDTFVDTVASFERNERSAAFDHFGWHPRTGPDVDEREGHVFVGNLLVASESFRKPLLRFEQPKALCARLTRPQVKELDGNVYVRAGTGAGQPLLVWSPVEGETCQVDAAQARARAAAAGPANARRRPAGGAAPAGLVRAEAARARRVPGAALSAAR